MPVFAWIYLQSKNLAQSWDHTDSRPISASTIEEKSELDESSNDNKKLRLWNIQPSLPKIRMLRGKFF